MLISDIFKEHRAGNRILSVGDRVWVYGFYSIISQKAPLVNIPLTELEINFVPYVNPEGSPVMSGLKIGKYDQTLCSRLDFTNTDYSAPKGYSNHTKKIEHVHLFLSKEEAEDFYPIFLNQIEQNFEAQLDVQRKLHNDWLGRHYG